MTYLHLLIEPHVVETSTPDPDDAWDRASTSTTWTTSGIELSDKDGERAMKADFPVKAGDDVFVVYVIYSTGDSFGHDEGGSVEIISFNKNADNAFVNVKAVSDGGDRRIRFDGGTVAPMRYVPWEGYFERLDRVCVEKLLVRPA